MPILALPLEADGAIIRVGIAVSEPRNNALISEGQSPPPPVLVRAVVDTGASCTCVDPAVIQKLRLTPSGTTPVHTPSTGGTPVSRNQFDVAIGIVMDAGQVHVSSLIIPVVESDLAGLGIQALLGRDVLDQGIFIYDGRRKVLTLAF